MKKLLLTLFLLVNSIWLFAQYSENFDGPTISMTPSGPGSWTIDNSYFVSSPNSYRGQYGTSEYTAAQTDQIDASLYSFVVLKFKHICKIDFIDTAKVEISTDGGVSWVQLQDNALPGFSNCIYQGSSPNFRTSGSKFSEGSYPTTWAPGQPTPPDNLTWWKEETFDISTLAALQPDVRIRFKAIDVPTPTPGMGPGEYGWLIEDVNVQLATCELNPPTFGTPTPNPIGTYYSLNPLVFTIPITDPSLIATADLFWTVNGGPVQTFSMFDVGTGYLGQLDNFGAGFNDLDSVCWWIVAVDNSGCFNTANYPGTINPTCNSVIFSSGIHFPFCDNFDGNDLWSVDPVGGGGTPWEHGAPTNPGLPGPHSAPNVWGVGLSTDYSSPDTTRLLSPVFDFSTTLLATLSFWQTRVCEDGWDGARLDWTNDGGITWNVLGTLNDPNGTNWYNDDQLNSSLLPAWTDLTTGWVQSKYKLGTVTSPTSICGSQTGVQFRFVFTADGSVSDPGFLIDDWCIVEPPPHDLGVTAITSPVNGSGLPAGTSVPIDITIENFGKNPETTFNIGYSINGVVQTSQTYTGPSIPVGGIVPFTLPNFTFPTGAITVCAWTELVGDGFAPNDTSCGSYVGVPTLNLTYCDDFESGNVGWTAQNFGDPGTNWELGTPAFQSTSSGNNGSLNAWDINLTTGYTANAEAHLYSPFFDFSGVANSRLQFAYNCAAEFGWDGTRLEYTSDGGATWNILGGGSTTNPDPCGTNWYTDDQLNIILLPGWTGDIGVWKTATYKLCCTTGILGNPLPVQFRFIFHSDGSINHDGFSIDDFCLYASTGDDIGISSIITPAGGYPVGTSTPVVVVLENFGSTTVTNAQITYVANGNTVNFPWSGNIPPCGSVSVTLPSFNIIQGTNDVCAYTVLASDVNHANDTTCITVIGQPILTPTYLNNYTDNFESGNIGWAPSLGPQGDPGTTWEFGYPNFGQTTGAHKSPIPTGTAWDVNLNTATTDNALAYLTTPYFDLTNANSARLSFYQNRSMDAFGDQFYIQYSINQSPIWQTLGTNTLTDVTNWYNNANYWNDVTSSADFAWVYSSIKNISQLVGNPSLIQFRFVYFTDGFSTSEGVSIDDFQLFVPIPLSITPVSVNLGNPNTLVLPGQQITFNAPIMNNGLNSVFNHNATLTIDGQVVSVDPITYTPTPLLSDSVIVHTFNTTWQAVPGFHTVCVYTDTPNGSIDLTTFDDTICRTVLVFDSINTNAYPYCNDFETSTQWVTLNAIKYTPNTIWQLGAPTQNYLHSAHSGNKAWSLYLDSNYVNKDSSGLFSSLFRVQTSHCYKLSFWHQFRMEYGSDGGAVEYSKDLGQTWEAIDYSGTPGVITNGGFNTNYSYVVSLYPNQPTGRGFTGYLNNWTRTEKFIRPDFNGQIIVRWRFASDYSARDEGWSIDDVCFEDMGICVPLGVNDFAFDDFGLSQNYPNPASGSTTFEYMIPKEGKVKIVLTDMIGQVLENIVEGNESAGKHLIEYNTSSLAPGIYTYTLYYDDQQITKRLVVTK